MITTDKFVFIHMHKTGGQSIIHSIEECVPGFRDIGYHYPHHLLPPEYSDLPVVGMVRNPWDWYISWYAYNILLKGENPLFFILSDGCQADYKNTLKNLINLGADTPRSQNYRNALIEALPETLDDSNRGSGLTKDSIRNFKDDDCGYYSWLFKRMHGEPGGKTTYIGRFENLQNDFLSMMEQLCVEETEAIREKFNGSARLNESSHSHYSRYYDDELRALIASKEQFIIDKYGYEFEQASDSETVIEFPSVQIYGIQDKFQKLSGKDNNFLLLCSDIDVEPIKIKLAQIPEDAWGQSDREHQFEIHHQTKALLLVYDDDFRHFNPTYLDIFSQFEDELKPLLDFIADHFQHVGFVVRLIFAKLQGQGKIPRHADRVYSLLKCHRIHVPIISDDYILSIATLGATYLEGDVVNRDYQRAFNYFLRAAELGHLQSIYKVSQFYLNGAGVTQSNEKAAYWFKEAAIQGHLQAQQAYALMFAQGKGVSRDYVQAYAWINMPAEAGDQEAIKNRARLLGLMGPEDTQKAIELAEIFRNKFAEDNK